MKTHRVNKGGQTPQRAPRTPGVRCQELHLCANGTGLGIRDYQIPNYKQLPDLFVRGIREISWSPPAPPAPVPSEAEGYRDLRCLLGRDMGRGGPPINRQPTWPSSPGQSMHLPADSCTSLGGEGGGRSGSAASSAPHTSSGFFPGPEKGLFPTHILRWSSPQETFPCIDLLQQLQVHSANLRASGSTVTQPQEQE